jgi:low temperature requirement protein LtrA
VSATSGPDLAPGPEESGEADRADWFELFFDLVVVAAIGTTNDAYLEHASPVMAAEGLLALTTLALIWFLTVLSQNLVPGRDLVRRVLQLLQMASLVVAALAVDQQTGISNEAGLLAVGVAFGLNAVLLGRALRGRASGVEPVRRVRRAALVGAAVCVAGAALPAGVVWAPLAFALAIVLMPTLIAFSARSPLQPALRVGHLRERLGLFVLIVLGEGFVQLVVFLRGLKSIPSVWFFALTFVASFAVWWLYFEGRGGGSAGPRWRLVLLAHLGLVFGIIGTFDNLAILSAGKAGAAHPVEPYLGIALATVLACLALLGYATEGRLGLVGWVQAGSAVGMLALGLQAGITAHATAEAVSLASSLVLIANAVVAMSVRLSGIRGDTA